MIHQKMAHRSFTFEGCYHLAWVLERIQDHHANRIGELMPWEYYAIVQEQKADAETQSAA